MAVTRVEVAIEADGVEDEGIDVLANIVMSLGLDPARDVRGAVIPRNDGEPILVAIIYPGAADGDDDPADIAADAADAVEGEEDA